MLLGVGFEGGLAVVACALGWIFGPPPFETWHWRLRDVGLAVIATTPMLAALIVFAHSELAPLVRIRRIVDEFLRPLFRHSTILDLALISLVAGLGEELLFRAILQSWFTDSLGVWPGIVLASALFGLLHLVTPTYGVIAALIGGYLGWVWEVNGNLLVVVIVHALYDFIALVYLLRCRSELLTTESLVPDPTNTVQATANASVNDCPNG